MTVPATADLMDDYADELQSCELQLKSFGLRKKFNGRISTVKCFEDNVLFKEQLKLPGDGGVLVVDGGGSLRTALMGDMNAELGRKNGWSGVVVFGVIRDSAVIDTMDFGCKCLGTNPRKSVKAGKGEVGVEVSFGSVTFRPGDWLWSDEDGVVVATRSLPPTR